MSAPWVNCILAAMTGRITGVTEPVQAACHKPNLPSPTPGQRQSRLAWCNACGSCWMMQVAMPCWREGLLSTQPP